MRTTPVALVLTLAAAVAACSPKSASTSSDNAGSSLAASTGAPVTDASLPPNANPVGAPKRPLSDLPSITLKPNGKNTYPGEVAFEEAKNGIGVRLQARNANASPGTAFPAEIARGACGQSAKTLYRLSPVKDGVSITTLHNVTLAQIQAPNTIVHVVDPATHNDILCGAVVFGPLQHPR